MPIACTHSMALVGVHGHDVEIEADIRNGLPGLLLVGDQDHPLVAVPGPVTSESSAGCHLAIRECGAECVTGARDVIAHVSFGAYDLTELPLGSVLPRDSLDPESRSVLEAVPARVGWGPARIAVTAGVDFDSVMRCLGQLATGGFVERCERGWRLRSPS